MPAALSTKHLAALITSKRTPRIGLLFFKPLSLCLHSILFVSVALSTVERQCSREAAFFHALEGPVFSVLRSDSVALSDVWQDLPGARQ